MTIDLTRRLVIGPLLGLAFVGCEAPPRESGFPTERRVLTEVHRIGSEESPETALTPVSDLIVRDSRVYVLQAMEGSVRVFSEKGDFLKRIGSRGSGPGEFVRPTALGWKGDSIWVLDPGLARVSLFQTDGTFLNTLSLPRLTVGLTEGRLSGLIPLSGGSYAGLLSYSGAAITSGEVRSRPVLRLDQTGRIADTLVLLPVHQRSAMVFVNGESTTYMSQPIKDSPLFDVSPDGDELVVIDRRVSPEAVNPHVTLTKLVAAGDTTFSMEILFDPIPLAVSDVEGFVFSPQYEFVSQFSEEEIKEKLWIPPFLPAASKIVLGEDGTVWIRREDDLRSQSFRWDVLGSRGEPLFWVELPRRTDILWAGREIFWVVELDELDVPNVVSYAVDSAKGEEESVP